MDAGTALKMGRVYRAVDTLAANVSPDLTIRQVLAMLYVASRAPEPVTQQQLQFDLDMQKGTVSKVVSSLTGQLGAAKANGLDVFRVDINPEDTRGRIIMLNKDSDKLLTKVAKMLFD
jgi:DNA-binding MarR family transcriptional regulator